MNCWNCGIISEKINTLSHILFNQYVLFMQKSKLKEFYLKDFYFQNLRSFTDFLPVASHIGSE